MWGPILPGTVGLILGRSSITIKRFQVLPGVIDADYTGEIKVMAQTTSIVQTLSSDKIAQLVLIPHVKTENVLTSKERRESGFESSGIYWVQ